MITFFLNKKYDTLLTNETGRYVQRWLLYECSKSYEQIFSDNEPSPGLCFEDNTWQNASNYCRRISLSM